MKSRLQRVVYFSPDQRNPIILPGKHHTTFLVVDETHRRYWYPNFAIVLNEIRQVYMIPSLRTILQSVRFRSQICKDVPEKRSLPLSRLVARIKPFTYVGVDYASHQSWSKLEDEMKKVGVYCTRV